MGLTFNLVRISFNWRISFLLIIKIIKWLFINIQFHKYLNIYRFVSRKFNHLSNLENAAGIRNIFAVCKFGKCNDSSQQIFGIFRSMYVSVNSVVELKLDELIQYLVWFGLFKSYTIYKKVYFLSMYLNFGGSNQIQFKSCQQNRVTTWNYGQKSTSYQLSSSKLKNWSHTIVR